MGRFAGLRLAVQGAASRLELITAKRPFATGRNGSEADGSQPSALNDSSAAIRL
jgi:hypothetical protein